MNPNNNPSPSRPVPASDRRETPCPVTGNNACRFDYCDEGHCFLREFCNARERVTTPPAAPARTEE